MSYLKLFTKELTEGIFRKVICREELIENIEHYRSVSFGRDIMNTNE